MRLNRIYNPMTANPQLGCRASYSVGGIVEEYHMTKGNGLPCTRCGTSAWDKSGACTHCRRATQREFAKTAKGKAKNKRYTDKNKGKLAEYQKKWWQKNKETRKEENRERARLWGKNNPSKKKAKDNRRRARINNSKGEFSHDEWIRLCNKYNNRCVKCGKKRKLTADHVVPISKGGDSYITNIQPLCKPCNSSKKDRHIDYRVKGSVFRWVQNKLPF